MGNGSETMGEDNGLPVTHGWYPHDAFPCVVLRAKTAPRHAYIADARESGAWQRYASAASTSAIESGTAAGLDGAMRAARDALWRVDGYERGEVRGVHLPAIEPYTKGPTALPGLAGLWTVTRWVLSPTGSGVEVDARKVDEDVGEPLDPEASVHVEVVRNPRAFALRRVECVVVASGPTATDSARPSPDRAAWLLHPVSSAGRQTIAVSQYEELRREAVALRANPTARAEPRPLDDTAEIVDDPDALGCAADCGREGEPLIATGAGCAPLCVRCYTVAVREDERRRAIAAPTGHAVAGVVAKVDEARSVASSKGANHAGESAMAYRYEGMRDAFDIARDMIRSTFAAPADAVGKVVAEVMAVDVADVIAGGEQDMLIAVDELNRELFHGTPAGHVVTLRKLGALAIQYLAASSAKGGA